LERSSKKSGNGTVFAYDSAVKQRLTISEMQSMGGKACAAKLSAERRKKIASAAAKARAAKLSPGRCKEIASAAAQVRPRKKRL